jgi:hypothetical protein
MENRNIAEFSDSEILLECTYTGRQTAIQAAAVVTATSPLQNDELALANY